MSIIDGRPRQLDWRVAPGDESYVTVRPRDGDPMPTSVVLWLGAWSDANAKGAADEVVGEEDGDARRITVSVSVGGYGATWPH
jgi:hypothetical protein